MTVAFLTMILAIGQPAGEGQQADGVDKVQLDRWQKYYHQVASEYQMVFGSGRTAPLKLHDKPVITYFNPVGGGQTLGAMFVWTNEGRPEIAGAIWSKLNGETRRVIHSFHSLSLEPVQAERHGTDFWAPIQPGVTPVLIPAGPAVAATAPQRLAQMRSLARDFTASTVRGSAERELRMLPQPVFRFESGDADRDGGLFVWFEDWDPELLLLMETRTTPQGAKWHASFARFTNLPVAARYQGNQVWSFAASADEPSQGGHDRRYISVHGVDVLPALREE